MRTAGRPAAPLQLISLFVLLLLASRASSQTADGILFDETLSTTLFAFDEFSIPFSRGLKLEMRKPERHPANPVVKRGAAGSPDSWAVQFYGSVIRDPAGGGFRLWYVAAGDDRLDKSQPRSSPWRVACAESDDGIHWTKPNLGLVDYMSSRNNNLVRMEPRLGTVNVKVLHDPDDPDPQRRYKMGAHVWFPKNEVRLGTLAPYASADGLDWKLLVEDPQPIDFEMSPVDMVLPALHFEPVGGLYKWGGLFHLSGQNAIHATRPYHGRVVRSFVSADFVNWSPSSAISFVRPQQHDLLGPGRSREGEQTHEGISVWNRGNVLVGLSGVWHGAAKWSGVTIDLSLVVSNDGLHFRAPVHERNFLERGADGAWDQGGLLQGQGFENIGAQTFVYYGAWDPRGWESSPPRGGIGIAMLERDRFAELVVDETTKGDGNYQLAEIVSEFITAPIDIEADGPRRFHVNAGGLGAEARLKIELLDHLTRPVPGYSGDQAAVVHTSGFQTPVAWDNEESIAELPERVRLKVTFEGEKNADIRFHALYVR